MRYLRRAFTEAAMDIRRVTHEGHVMVRLEDVLTFLRGNSRSRYCMGAAMELECLFNGEPEEEDAA